MYLPINTLPNCGMTIFAAVITAAPAPNFEFTYPLPLKGTPPILGGEFFFSSPKISPLSGVDIGVILLFLCFQIKKLSLYKETELTYLLT